MTAFIETVGPCAHAAELAPYVHDGLTRARVMTCTACGCRATSC